MVKTTLNMKRLTLSKAQFIILEGGEGTGKSTVAKALHKHFKLNKQKAIVTREPGGTPLGKQLRHILLEEGEHYCQDIQLLLLNAARLAHWKHIIKPALQNGCHVICDRFVDSTRVYQALIHPNANEKLDQVNRLHHEFLKDAVPNTVLVLDMEPEESLKRLQGRNEINYLDTQPLAFHQAIRQGFQNLASQGNPYHLIQADAPSERVISDCLKALNQL